MYTLSSIAVKLGATVAGPTSMGVLGGKTLSSGEVGTVTSWPMCPGLIIHGASSGLPTGPQFVKAGPLPLSG